MKIEYPFMRSRSADCDNIASINMSSLMASSGNTDSELQLPHLIGPHHL